MKTHPQKRGRLSVGAAAAMVAAAVVVVATSESGERTEATRQGAASETHRVVGTANFARGIAGSAEAPSSFEPRSSRAPKRQTRSRMVRVDPHQILATVGGMPIRIAQLMPRPSEAGEVGIERSLFRSRLRRAIEAELVFQAASRAGIGLSEGQRQRLERMHAAPEAAVDRLTGHGVSWHSLADDELAFKRRMMEAMMLRQNLVAARDQVAPSPDPTRQAAYEEALENLLVELEEQADVDVRSLASG